MAIEFERAALHDLHRALAGLGMAAVAVAVGMIAALHVVAPELSPAWTMISDYALGGSRALFDGGVLLLVAGSMAVLLAMIRAGLLHRAPGTVALLSTWCLAMVVVVAFPNCCRTGVTLSGYVHAIASMIGFLCLPTAALLLGRRWRMHPRWRLHAARARVLGILSLIWLAPMVLGLVPVASIARPLWAVVPFGLIERGLAVTEVAVLLCLGAWARRCGGPAPASLPPATPALSTSR